MNAAQQVIEKAMPFLDLCPSCDGGLRKSCTCPPGDYRAVMLALVLALQAELARHPEELP